MLRDRLAGPLYSAERFGWSYLFLRIIRKLTGSSSIELASLKYYERHADKLSHLSQDKLVSYLSRLYSFNTGETLNLSAPANYNQKIQWLKIYDNLPIKSKLADKYQVREWIADKIGPQYLVPLLGVWDDPESIDFDSLPSRFCLKANHGSGMNIAVRDKSSLDVGDAVKKMRFWLAAPYGINRYEPQYFSILRKIIAEEYIEQSDGDLVDYKIHCFDGKAGIIQIIGSRDLNAHTALEAFYSTDWVRNDLMHHAYDSYQDEVNRPEFLDEMLRIAETLSSGFRYVRVDLYHVDGGIKFGEMTFTPAAGFATWGSGGNNEIVGDRIRIS